MYEIGKSTVNDDDDEVKHDANDDSRVRVMVIMVVMVVMVVMVLGMVRVMMR